MTYSIFSQTPNNALKEPMFFGQPVNVDYTVAGGKFVVKEGQLVTVDKSKLIEKHNKAAKRLLQG